MEAWGSVRNPQGCIGGLGRNRQLSGIGPADNGSVGAGADLWGRPATAAIHLPVGAPDAVQHMRLLNTGCRELVDADLSNNYGEIRHSELVASVA